MGLCFYGHKDSAQGAGLERCTLPYEVHAFQTSSSRPVSKVELRLSKHPKLNTYLQTRSKTPWPKISSKKSVKRGSLRYLGTIQTRVSMLAGFCKQKFHPRQQQKRRVAINMKRKSPRKSPTSMLDSQHEQARLMLESWPVALASKYDRIHEPKLGKVLLCRVAYESGSELFAAATMGQGRKMIGKWRRNAKRDQLYPVVLLHWMSNWKLPCL